MAYEHQYLMRLFSIMRVCQPCNRLVHPTIADTLKALQYFGGDESSHRPGDGMGECFTTLVAKESTLVMMCSTNRGEMVSSRLVAPFATVALGSPLNRDGLTKCIVRHMFPSFLRRSQYLMCFSIFMQYVEFIMLLSVALVLIRP